MLEIKLTKKQYRDLLELIYLGNWMINAIRSGAPGDEQIEKYNDVEQHIFSFAQKAGAKNYIKYDKKLKKFFPTREFEEETDVEQYHQEYDEETFWEELIVKLTWRDFVKEYGEKAIREMSVKERIEKEYPFEEKYRKEFGQNGLQNLALYHLRGANLRLDSH